MHEYCSRQADALARAAVRGAEVLFAASCVALARAGQRERAVSVRGGTPRERVGRSD